MSLIIPIHSVTEIPHISLSLTPPLRFTEKECLATCVQNMQQSDDLSPLEIVEMFAGLSCFLKDSSDVSQTLLDDFRMCQGYTFLCDLMLRYSLGLPTVHHRFLKSPRAIGDRWLLHIKYELPKSAKVAAGGCFFEIGCTEGAGQKPSP